MTWREREAAEMKKHAIEGLIQTSIQHEEVIRLMTPRTKKLHIDRITTNIPQAYEKFFFRPKRSGFVNVQDHTVKEVKEIVCECPTLPELDDRGAFKASFKSGLHLQQRKRLIESTHQSP
jgi:hypothetical protein